ncbi:hypothetical protein WG907_05165 [Sphingobium sp. AN558]|uniref:hypothetical protein n=1 Tax=Sphingobium sp. AN558 TaxID=3133442 RepID=UPI0030C458A8
MDWLGKRGECMGGMRKAALWCWDNWDKLSAVGVAVVAFAGPAWAAYFSPFIAAYAPLSWVVAGLAGLIIVTVIMCAGSWTYSRFNLARLTAIIMERSGVNPLDDRFDRKTIRLIDFYRPQYVSHKNKDFRDCEVIGPGLVYFSNVTFDHCEFKQVQIAIINETKTMWGMTIFESPKFLNCDIVNLTMMMNRATYDVLHPEMKQYVPVINGKFP